MYVTKFSGIKRALSAVVMFTCLTAGAVLIFEAAGLWAVTSITGGNTDEIMIKQKEALQAKIEACNGQITDVQNRIKQLADEISALNSELTEHSGRKPVPPAIATRDEKMKYQQDMDGWQKRFNELKKVIGKKESGIGEAMNRLENLQKMLDGLKAQQANAGNK